MVNLWARKPGGLDSNPRPGAGVWLGVQPLPGMLEALVSTPALEGNRVNFSLGCLVAMWLCHLWSSHLASLGLVSSPYLQDEDEIVSSGGRASGSGEELRALT